MKDGFYGKSGYFADFMSAVDFEIVGSSEERHTMAMNKTMSRKKTLK
jgi:hypothetical protein